MHARFDKRLKGVGASQGGRSWARPGVCWCRFALVLGWVMASGLLSAQDAATPAPSTTTPPKDYSLLGYLRFVNATGYEGVVKVTLDGEDINPAGYETGVATGSVGFPPKTCQIEMRHETLGEVKLSATLKPGEVTSIIALPMIQEVKPKPGESKDPTKKPTPKIELAAEVIANPGYVRGKEVSVTVLQATVAEELAVTVGRVPVTCAKLKPTTVSLGNSVGEFVPITLGGKTLLTLNFVDRSDRVVILYPNKQGVVQNLTLSNEVF
jgi:hypothetical protein